MSRRYGKAPLHCGHMMQSIKFRSTQFGLGASFLFIACSMDRVPTYAETHNNASTGGATSATGGSASATGGKAAGGTPAATGGQASTGGSGAATGGRTAFVIGQCDNLTAAAAAGTSGVPKPSGTAGNLKVTNWAGYKAAVSWTFDDSQPSQIQHYADLASVGVPMTFYISSANSTESNYDATWTQALRTAANLETIRCTIATPT